MWLVLCDSGDISALWAYKGLETRGVAPLELVGAEALACSMCWEHRLGADGATADVQLTDGRSIRHDTTRGVLNRLSTVPARHVFTARPEDRDYASQELHAFFVSWLHCLPCPVINRPTPQGLSGQWRRLSEWMWLASRAGLPTRGYRRTSCDRIEMDAVGYASAPPGMSVRTVLVLNGHVVGRDAPASVCEGCRRLAVLSRTALLGVEFHVDPAESWVFGGATCLPDLRLGGEALLDVLTSVLRGEAEGRQ